jgi:hypothetical protein
MCSGHVRLYVYTRAVWVECDHPPLPARSDKLRNWKSIRHARHEILLDIEFDAFEKWLSEAYSAKGRPPTEEETREFGLAMNVADYNPPIDPRLPRFE